MSNDANALKLIGGSHFLERKSLLVLAPYLILTSVSVASLNELTFSPTEPQLEASWLANLLIANSLSLLACWMLVELLYRTVLRNRHKKSIPLVFVLLVSFCVGATKGLTTGLFGLWLGSFPDLDSSIGSRWLQTGVLGMVTIPLLALSTLKIAQINQKREVLIADSVRDLLNSNRAPSDSLKKQVDALKLRSLSVLTEVEQEIRSKTSNARTLFESAIQDLLANHIRPMSHSIWQERQRRLPVFTIPTLLRAGIMSPSLNPLISASLFWLPLFMSYAQLVPVQDALLRALVVSGVTALITRGYGLIRSGLVSLYIFGYLVALTGAVSLGLYLSDLIFGEIRNGSFALTWFVATILALQTFLLATLGHQMITADRSLERELELLFSEVDIEDRARLAHSTLINRDYAQFLHSDVQNQVLVSALAARQDGFTNEDLLGEIQRLRSLFNELENDRSIDVAVTFQDLMTTMSERWEGFLELEFSIDEKLLRVKCNRGWALSEVLNEAISNSIRHGKASSVKVSITENLRGFEVQVADDGLGPTAGKTGLGSKIIDEITQGDWQLCQGVSGGSVLNLRLTN